MKSRIRPRRVSWKLGRPLPRDTHMVDIPSVFCTQFQRRPGVMREQAAVMFKRWLADPRQRQFRKMVRAQLRHKAARACRCAEGDPHCRTIVLLQVAESPFEQ
jgi:hypothetical protein